MAALTMALVFAACGEAGGGKAADPTPETLESYLKEREANTVDTPYTVTIAEGTNLSDGAMGTINNAVLEAGVFVNLDLSKCRALGNTIRGVLFYTENPELPENEIRPSGSDFNIIWDNRYIKSIVLPGSLQTVGDYALCRCENYLESVTIGNSVTSIEFGAFAYCKALTSAVIPDSVESIWYSAFFTCSSLESVTIGSGVKNIHNWAFGLCGALTSVTFRGSGAVIETDDTFPEGAGLKAAYEAGGAGAYTLSEGVWTKE